MKLILVCGPWSSGTTAVAGMLDAFGLNGVAPFFRTNDKRTKNSFESIAFREVVDLLASDKTLALKPDRPPAIATLQALHDRLQAAGLGGGDAALPIFLKYPLSALLIAQISRVFDTRLVYVLRPMKGIEETRLRRGWAAHFGAAGAKVLYAHMFQVLLDRSIPTMMVRYPELLRAPKRHAKQLAEFCGVAPDKAQLEAATQFVRKAAPDDKSAKA